MPSQQHIVRELVWAGMISQTRGGLRKENLQRNRRTAKVEGAKKTLPAALVKWNSVVAATRKKLVSLKIIPSKKVKIGIGVFGHKLWRFSRMEYYARGGFEQYMVHLEYMADKAVQNPALFACS